MSFDKAIEYGKVKRRPYKGAKAYDRTCRNHGSCPYCRNTRLYKTNKELEKTDYDLSHYDEYIYGDDTIE